MKRILAILSLITGLLAAGTVSISHGETAAGSPQEMLSIQLDKVETAPFGTLQLFQAVFIAPEHLQRLGLRSGDPVRVTHGERSIEARAHRIDRAPDVIAMRRSLRDSLGIAVGSYRVRVEALAPSQARLEPQRLSMYMERYPGDIGRWPRIALGAPHGDCDLFTGEIAGMVNEQYGIPVVAAYGYRFSYMGRWFDVNRPLQRPPREREGVVSERQATARALQVTGRYQRMIHDVCGLPGHAQLEFLCSFHGHGMTVMLPDSQVVEARVIEGVGTGFTHQELRMIKEEYRRLADQLYDDPPLLVFGNLPEDQRYTVAGVERAFLYSALGTRSYGTLRRDLARKGLHLETPNSMRFDPQVRPRTARLLGELYTFIRDRLLEDGGGEMPVGAAIQVGGAKNETSAAAAAEMAPSGEMVHVPAGTFLMGAPEGEGWSMQRPRHRVTLQGYWIDRHEVTNGQYCRFLNKAWRDGSIFIEGGYIVDAGDPDRILFALPEARPLSQILWDGGMFHCLEGREHFPVVFVSWHGARAYAAHEGKRLPTEAEWERAASWDSARKQPWRYATGSDTLGAGLANYDNSRDDYERGPYPWTTPAGFYRDQAGAESPCGCADMSGNVWEWTADWMKSDYYQQTPEGGWKDPQGPPEGTMKVYRGGSWTNISSKLTASFRLGFEPNATLIDVGFRCARSEDGWPRGTDRESP